MPGKREKSKNRGYANNSRTPTQPVDRTKVQNPDLLRKLRQEAEEQHQRKLTRRKIRERLDDLLKRGETCEIDIVLEFVDTFENDLDLVREVLPQYGYSADFPIDTIRRYVSNGSTQELLQELERHERLVQLANQKDAIKTQLINPVIVQVETNEDGPQFASLTPEKVRWLIGDMLGGVSDIFSIEGAFPFIHRGIYSLQLNLPLGVKLPFTIQVEAQSDELPEDCAQDFKDILPLPLSETADVSISLQDNISKASPTNIMTYSSCLSSVILTAFQLGYGKTPWVQALLHEWRNKRGEYSLAHGVSKIKEAIEQINNSGAWLIPNEIDEKELSKGKILEIAQILLAKDPVLSQYDVELSIKDNIQQSALRVGLSWRGLEMGLINLSNPAVSVPQSKLSRKEQPPGRDNKYLSQTLDLTLNKVLHNYNAKKDIALLEYIPSELDALFKGVKEDVPECELDEIELDSLPTSLTLLQIEIRKLIGRPTRARADHFLQLTKAYAEKGEENLLQFSLAEYFYLQGCQLFYETNVDARLYFQLFLLFYSQFSSDEQYTFVRTFYNTLSFYLRTYSIFVEVKESTPAEIADKFFSNLLSALSFLTKQNQIESLGQFIVEIAGVAPSFVIELIHRLRTYKDNQYLRVLIMALQEIRVFRMEPWRCLYILALINPITIADALARQSFSTADERKRIANALLRFASLPTSPAPNVIMNRFTTKALHETPAKLAFALFKEPFILNAPDKETALKSDLIAEILGLPHDIAATEYFLGKISELTLLFDRFEGKQDPKSKKENANTILDMLRFTRDRFIDSLSKTYGKEIVYENYNEAILFFTRAEEYAKAEQEKLIYDTTLQLVLMSDETPHLSENTRVIIEIRNDGEGIADQLELEVLPVNDKYTVEDHHRIHKIGKLTDKTSIQREIFIRPLIDINEVIELSLVLRYDTPEKKGKTTELDYTNRAVRLYSKSHFTRVDQPYSISMPATTWFYGREDVLETLADNLRTGTNHDTSMIVYGLKRTGKTSVVKRLIQNTLRTRGYGTTHLPIYTDLLLYPQVKEIKTEGEFLYLLIEIIVSELTEEPWLISLPFDLTEMREEFYQQPYTAFSTRLKEIVQALAGRHLILVLDEFSTLYENTLQTKEDIALTPGLFAFLSNTIQSIPQLTFIFTGTYQLLEMMSTYMYDLAKICFPLMINFLDDTSARQLVTEPVKGNENEPNNGWLEYDSRVVDRIVTYTNRHPYLIQCLCMQVVNRMNILKYPRVNLVDIDTIIHDIIFVSANETVMLNLWNDLGVPQQKVLSAIAAQTNSSKDGVEVSSIAAIFKELGEPISLEHIDVHCASLADAELLEKVASTSYQSQSYRITIPLYHYWLKQNKPLRSLIGKRALH